MTQNTNQTQKKDVYQIVTDRILEQLDKGVVPWQQPWSNTLHGTQTHGMSYNYITRKPYSIMNQMLLSRKGKAYITWKQVQQLHGHVNKGAKAEIVVFWKMYKTKDLLVDSEGNPILDRNGRPQFKVVPVLRYYNVFCIDDTDIKPEAEPEAEPEAIPADENAEAIIRNYLESGNAPKLFIEFSNDAYYQPATDSVHVPCREQYTQIEEFYSTLFHELTHSTGHRSRLDRLTGVTRFGSETYSKEELVAEIGAATLVNIAGLETEKSFQNSAAYIASWARKLREDRKMIMIAATRAQKAVNLITAGMFEDEDPEAVEAE